MALMDTCELLQILCWCPTHTQKLVPADLSFIGYHDATAEGAGGVWFPFNPSPSPILWQVLFPPDIQQTLISKLNPHGYLTNSDLELATAILATGLLANVTGICHLSVGTFCDNTLTVS